MLAPVLGVATFLAGVVATVLVDRAYGPGDALWAVIWLGSPLVGGVTAALRPRNAIGWVLLAAGVFGVCSQFSYAYSPGPHPTDLQALVIAAGTALLYVGMELVGILVLLFPSGRLAAGWRPRVVKLVAVVLVVGSIESFFIPELSGDAQSYHNPLSLPAWDGLTSTVSHAVTLFYVAFLVVAVADAVLRLRRSRSVERQQFKWLAYSSLLLAPAIIFTSVTPTSWWWSVIPLLVAANGLAGSIGLAIVRYRLYDIDRLVSRSVSYLLVVGVLFGVYIGSVLLLTVVLPLRGSVSVVIAVLVAVALFAPLRVRARAWVDKRFNRSRYDAQAVVDAFAGRLGEQVTLEAITSDLLQAVDETVQPSHASLWLRGP
ncbi:MAG TPA: hypothetical protein VMW80_02235 [Candidatus Dormibacteraeota bacterium]|nr:hypothetical protein [Candidatus Dormibacteraeota bacterium]